MELETLVGNGKVKEILKHTIQTKNFLHSYLFLGEAGIGKKLFAKEFAKAILCLEENRPCGNCKSCIEMEERNQPDYSEIVPEGNSIKIEQIRNLQLKILEKPIISDKKVYIIDEADKMTQEAQNALLKTLEEPPEYITILLIASDENSLLTTIKSRCTKVVFEPIEKEELRKYAKTELGQDTITEELLLASMGSIAKLRDKLQNQALYTQLDSCFKQIEKVTLLEWLENAECIYQEKENSKEILEYMISTFFRLAKERKEKQLNYLQCIEVINETRKNLSSNSNYDMQIDHMLMKIWEEIHEKNYWSSF